MIRYKNCKLYKKSDPHKKTVAVIDIESNSALVVYSSFENEHVKEDRAMTAFTTDTEYLMTGTGYNLELPLIGEFKITRYEQTNANRGDWKPKYRYTLTLEG